MSKMIRELDLNEIEAVVGGVDSLSAAGAAATMAARRPRQPAPTPDTSTGRYPIPSGTMNQPRLG